MGPVNNFPDLRVEEKPKGLSGSERPRVHSSSLVSVLCSGGVRKRRDGHKRPVICLFNEAGSAGDGKQLHGPFLKPENPGRSVSRRRYDTALFQFWCRAENNVAGRWLHLHLRFCQESKKGNRCCFTKGNEVELHRRKNLPLLVALKH